MFLFRSIHRSIARVLGPDLLDFPLKCTPRLCARANYIQNRENSQLLKFNNYISNKDINLLS